MNLAEASNLRRSEALPGALVGSRDGQPLRETDAAMPTISTFFGILIQMYWREHGPPHFHAIYGEHEAVIDIRELRVVRGRLPRRALAMVIEWALDHRDE